MARLIYAEEFERTLKDDVDFAIQGKGRNGDMEIFIPRSDVIGMLKQQPTVNPVKHGKWQQVYDGMYDRDWTCSICNKIPPHEECTKYCPNCGAKMEDD